MPFARRVLAWFRMLLRKIGETFQGLNKARWMRWANSLTTENLVAMAYGALLGSVKAAGHGGSRQGLVAMSRAEDQRLRDLLKTYASAQGAAPSEAEIAEAVRQYRQVERQYAEALQAHDEDGKPLPAPNGEPSKLNREQWVLVRTPNFKRWFGVWDVDSSRTIEPVAVDASRIPESALRSTAAMRQWLLTQEEFLAPVRNDDTGLVVGFTRANLKDSLK